MIDPEENVIPPRVKAVLMSWGAGVMILCALLSWWIWSSGREADRQDAQVRRDQENAMCAMLEVMITTDPSPSTERGVAVQEAMRRYRVTLDCQPLRE